MDPQSVARRKLFFAILILAFIAYMFYGFMTANKVETKEYKTTNSFFEDTNAGLVSSAEFYQTGFSTWQLKGKLKDGRLFTAVVTGKNADELDQQLRSKKIDVSVKAPQAPSAFWSFLPIIVIVLFVVWMMRGMKKNSAAGMQKQLKGKDPEQVKVPDVTFKDVAGLDEVVEEVREIKEYLSDTAKFSTLGAKAPKGVLLLGPPGCGKTLLARAIAGEAKVPFFSMSGSEFVEMFVGVGAARVRGLFAQAHQAINKGAKGAIIFIDEIDAVGRHRGSGLGGGHDEREQTLNQLLVEMDGFTKTPQIVIIAATNRPDILDPALLRPGRFDRHIQVDVPDLKGRIDILKVHAESKVMEPELDFTSIAKRTPGFTGADLENLLNEAATLAARKSDPFVTLVHIEKAIDRVLAGPEKRRIISAEEKRLIAYHEAGHALVGFMLEKADTVHRVSIVARGRALGLTWSVPKEEHVLATRGQLEARMAMTMGGRVAEEFVTGGDPTTGASNDIQVATQLARAMVTQWGLSDLGPIQYGDPEGSVYLGMSFGANKNYSEDIARKIDIEVDNLIGDAVDQAEEIITAHRAALDALVAELLIKETLEEDEIKTIFEANIVPQRP